MKCIDCKWCYNCVNGTSENFGEYTGLCCEDECKEGENDEN